MAINTLYLVRHGQASFGSQNYDRLSALGRLQARMLFLHWRGLGVGIHRVGAGTLSRQVETAHIATRVPLSGITQHAAFDEYPFHRLFEIDRNFQEETGQGEAGTIDWSQISKQAYQDRLLGLFDQGVDGLIAGSGLISWRAFRQRCYQGVVELMSTAAEGENVAIFSSAGAIGAITQELLGTDDSQTARLALSIHNSGMTSLEFDGQKLSLVQLNQTDHLGSSNGSTLHSHL